MERNGWIYVLHFDHPLAHARHYVGWTTDLGRRIGLHRRGVSKVKIIRALYQAGIGFRVGAVLPGTRDDERRIKRQRNTHRVCKECARNPQLELLLKAPKSEP